MANQRSDLMANILAKPAVLNAVRPGNGARTVAIASFVGDLAQDEKLPLARFKFADIILGAYLINTSLGAGVVADFGMYVAGDWTAADQALISGTAEDRLATAIDMNVARTFGNGTFANQPLNIMNESGTISQANSWAPLWTVAGFASEAASGPPGTEVDLALDLEVANPASGTIVVLFDVLRGL